MAKGIQDSAALTAEEIVARVAEHRQELQALGVRTLGLFGSFRQGNPHAGSDLDFLLTMDPPSFSKYMDIKFLLEGLLGRPVDLALGDSLKPRLRERVLSEVLYVPGLSPLS